jgi:hypothetical protein
MVGRRGALPVASLWLRRLHWLTLCGALCVLSPVHAQPIAPTYAATYEAQRVQQFLDSAKLQIDPAPEGKRIRYLRFERRRVFEPNDLLVPLVLPRFASTWPNAFHWLTEESRIRRELLLHEGERYAQHLADESTRNLLDLALFALVKVVAVKTDDPNEVGVVVYTRDLWSLRLEQSFAGAGAAFTVSGQLVERNFLGRGEWLALRGAIDPVTFSVGQSFTDSRLFGEPLRLSESLDVVFSRASVKPEGSTGTVRFGRPFYNLAQRFAAEVYASYSDLIARGLSGGRVIGVDLAHDLKACAPGADDCVARVWHDRRLRLEGAVSYAITERSRHVFSLGAVVNDRSVAPNAETGLRADQIDAFTQRVLPKVRRDVYPYLRYQLSVPQYVVFTNLATFGRSENVRVGPSLSGTIGLPLKAWGASSDGVIIDDLFGYVWAHRDALIDGAFEGLARLENGQAADRRAILRVRGATPSFEHLLGRFVLGFTWDVRDHDTQNTLVALGGDNGLRGYASQYFYAFGASSVLGNLEYRTRPWLLESIHLGAVAFYDVGSVYKQLSRARLHQAVGAGLRVLFPQFNPYVFRIDVGVPVGRERGGFAVQLSYGSEQTVLLTAAEDAQAVGRTTTGL